MNYIEDYSIFNQKYRLDAKSYVEANLYKLMDLFNMEDYDDSDKASEVLIQYFTKYPDQISRVMMKTTGMPKNYLLTTNNIGGVFKR